jgi:hypothetical protein
MKVLVTGGTGVVGRAGVADIEATELIGDSPE